LRVSRVAFVCWLLVLSLGAAERLKEAQLKAAFVFNGAKFVEWPSDSFANPADPLVMCVLGKGGVEEELRLATGRRVSTHSMIVRRISDAQDAAGCHILFVNESVGRRWLSLEKIKETGILTVGETDEFISQGGAINLRLEGNNVRIQVNLEAAHRARLEMSSKLLGLSEVVRK